MTIKRDRRPSDEGWSEKCDRLAAEEEAREKARRNEPAMAEVKFSFTWEQIGNFFKKLKRKKK